MLFAFVFVVALALWVVAMGHGVEVADHDMSLARFH